MKSLRSNSLMVATLLAAAAASGHAMLYADGAVTSNRTRPYREDKDVTERASGYRRKGGGQSVKANARAAAKARNVRRNRAAHR